MNTQNSIALRRAKKDVRFDAENQLSGFPCASLEKFAKTSTGYVAEGRYFYLQILDKGQPTEREIEIPHRTFARSFTPIEADAVFKMLNVSFPEGCTFSQRDDLQLNAALDLILATEKKWGIKPTDWEVVEIIRDEQTEEKHEKADIL